MMRLVIVASILCGLRLASAAEVADDLPPESGMRQHPVALEKFERLQSGLKRPEVERLLGKRGEHQFTYKDDKGTVWHNFGYVVAQEPRYASSEYHLLYKDGSLYAIMDYMDVWNHLKELGSAPDQVKDPVNRTERYIQESFRVKALRGDDIAASMAALKKHILDEERASEKRCPPDPGLTAVAILLNLQPTASELAESQRAYKTNVDLKRKFDGGKIDIGMTEAQVNKILGKPLLSDKLSEAEHVAIYGPLDSKAIGAVASWLACGPVAVLFHDNAAVCVMSNWYCDVDWRDRVWPELKSPERGSKE
jgi:hypothetical protein